MAHPELGSRILDQVLAAVGPLGKVDNQARLEGRSMSMVLSPDKKAAELARKAQETNDDTGTEPVGADTTGGDDAKDEDQ